MKILHVCNDNEQKWASRYYATDRKISNGFIRLGHFVYNFSYRFTARYLSPFRSKCGGVAKMNKSLCKTIEQLRPELLMLGHSELVEPQLLAKLKQQYPTMRIAMWYVDTLETDKPNYLKQLQGIQQKLPYLDGFFATTGGSNLEALAQYNEQCRLEFIPNMVDPSIETGQAFATETEIDLCYIAGSTQDREQLVSRIKHDFKDLNLCFRGLDGQSSVGGSEFIDILSRTAIGLNYSKYNSSYLSSSDRMAQLTGNGLACLTPRTPGMELLYSEDEVRYFEGADQLMVEIKALHNNPTERRALAEKGWRKTHQQYNNERVCQYMLDCLNDKAGAFLNF